MKTFSDVRVGLPRRARVGQTAVAKATQPAEKEPRASAPVPLPIPQLHCFLLPLFSGIIHRDVQVDIIPLIGTALKHAQRSSRKVLSFFSFRWDA